MGLNHENQGKKKMQPKSEGIVVYLRTTKTGASEKLYFSV